MSQFEYKVIPTPRRAKRAKGVKGEAARFANVLTDAMNAQAAEGWVFVRSETLPMERKTKMFKAPVELNQTVLVFRRSLDVPEHNDAILSMSPAEPNPASQPLLAQRREDLPEPVAEIEDTVQGKQVTFDGENIDPLKNLVEGHRKDSLST